MHARGATLSPPDITTALPPDPPGQRRQNPENGENQIHPRLPPRRASAPPVPPDRTHVGRPRHWARIHTPPHTGGPGAEAGDSPPAPGPTSGRAGFRAPRVPRARYPSLSRLDPHPLTFQDGAPKGPGCRHEGRRGARRC